MSTYSDLKSAKTQLILKPLDLIVIVGDYGVEIPQAITTGANADLITFGPEWHRLGLISKSEGAVFSSSVETDEIESYGELDPTRTDISKRTSTAKVVPQQLTRIASELYYQTSLAGNVSDPVTGETRIKNASGAEIRYYTFLFIGRDGSAEKPIYIAKCIPKGSISGVDDESWTPQSALTKGITISAHKDEDEDTTVIHIFGGKGWQEIRQDAGFGDPVSEVQRVAVPTATGGTFTLTFNGEQTSAIAYNAASTAVASALVALPSIGAGNVAVTGSAGGPYTVTFQGALAEMNVGQITGSGASLTPAGTVTVTTTTQGNS